MADSVKTLSVIAEMLRHEWQEERTAALDVLNALGSDTKDADLVAACHVVAGDYRGATSGRDFWKRETEAATARAERAEAALARLTDPDPNPCRYDHHDLCQEHGLSARPCATATARALLDSRAALSQEKEDG